jgi:hypothetical protein
MESLMKKVATALALAFAFAAPLAFSSSAVQASPVKSTTPMVKAVQGKQHKVLQHQANNGVKAMKKGKKKTRRTRK